MTTSNEGLWSHRRLALIIGNDDYQSNNKLSYSKNNVNDLKAVLEQMQFKVTLLLDVEKELLNNIATFAEEINDGDLIFFYFSGHGYQIDGENYLIPTADGKIQTEADILDFGCKAHSAVKRLKRNNPSYVTIFILDCSFPYILENRPTETEGTESKGLVPMQPTHETFIQFACNANQVNTDVPTVDRNSLFTKYLLQYIDKPNVPIANIFKNIGDAVYQNSNQKQRPLSMNGLEQYKQLCLNKNVIDDAMKTVFEDVLENCLEERIEEAVAIEQNIEEVTTNIMNQELIQFMQEISEKVIKELLVEEAVENVMKYVVEEIVEEVIEIVLEEIAEQCIEKITEVIVAEIMGQLLPEPYTVEECNLLLKELNSELETLTLKNTRQGVQDSAGLIGEIRGLILALTVHRNKANRAKFSISTKKEETRRSKASK